MYCIHGDPPLSEFAGPHNNSVYSDFHILHESNNVTMRGAVA